MEEACYLQHNKVINCDNKETYWWKIMTTEYKWSLLMQLFLSLEWLNALLLQCFHCLATQQKRVCAHPHTWCDWFLSPLLHDCHTYRGTTGSLLVKLVLTLTSETFSFLDGCCFLPFHVFNWCIFSSSRKFSDGCQQMALERTSETVAQASALPSKTRHGSRPTALGHCLTFFLTTLQLFNFCVSLSPWRVHMLKSGISPQKKGTSNRTTALSRVAEWNPHGENYRV